MDCCSKIDFAHFRTYGQVSSSLGSSLEPKFIKFWSNFAPKSTPKTDFIFQCRVCLKNLPKWGPKGPQNAWSELRKSSLGPLWPHQLQFLVSKTPLQSLKNVILVPYGGQSGPIFSLCKPFWRGNFCQQSPMHSSYNGVHCSQLIDRRLTFILMLGIIIQ